MIGPLARTVGLAGVLLAASACSDAVSLDEARETAVVEVAGATLTGATLEGWLLAAPAIPSPQVAGVLVSAFIEGALVGEALRQSASFEDSATASEAVLPDAIRGTILDHFARRAASLPEPSDAEADSVARLGGTRVFQHIRWLGDPRDSAVMGPKVPAIRAAASRAQTGEDFAALVREFSEDTVTRDRGGLLPAVVRSDLGDGPVAAAAWRLQPGEATAPIPSSSGVQILRRVPLVEARPQFKRWLAPRIARRVDSVWVDSVGVAKRLALTDDVPARLRALAREPIVVDGDAPFATWDGGALSPVQMRRWITMLPPVERVALTLAADSAAVLFALEVARRELVYASITGGGGITAQAWEALAPQYRAAVAQVREEMRPLLVNDDPSTAANRFVEAVTTGGVRYRPLPGGLAGVIRMRQTATVNHKAIEAIIAAAAPVWQQQRGDTTGATPPPAETPQP